MLLCSRNPHFRKCSFYARSKEHNSRPRHLEISSGSGVMKMAGEVSVLRLTSPDCRTGRGVRSSADALTQRLSFSQL